MPRRGGGRRRTPYGLGVGSANLYGYVLGDPVNLIDPSGRFWLPFGPSPFGIDETTLFGIAVGMMGSEAWDVSYDPIEMELVFEFYNNPVAERLGKDFTLGHAVCYAEPRPDPNPYNPTGHPTAWEHELAHTKQHSLLGNAYLPVYGIFTAVSGIVSGTLAAANPMETPPGPPTYAPWGGGPEPYPGLPRRTRRAE